jgi:hypothetical protein
MFFKFGEIARRRVSLCGAQAQGRSATARGRTERSFIGKILLVWGGIRTGFGFYFLAAG